MNGRTWTKVRKGVPLKVCRRSIVQFAFLVLFLISLEGAQAADYSLQVQATDGGDRYWFEFDDHPGENPTLSFAPGDSVNVTIVNVGNQPHNIHFGTPIARGSEYLAPGNSANFSFDIPGGIEPQQIEYWCDPHRQLGMVGEVFLGEGDVSGGSGETPQDTPGASIPYALVLLFAVAVAQRARRPDR